MISRTGKVEVMFDGQWEDPSVGSTPDIKEMRLSLSAFTLTNEPKPSSKAALNAKNKHNWGLSSKRGLGLNTIGLNEGGL